MATIGKILEKIKDELISNNEKDELVRLLQDMQTFGLFDAQLAATIEENETVDKKLQEDRAKAIISGADNAFASNLYSQQQELLGSSALTDFLGIGEVLGSLSLETGKALVKSLSNFNKHIEENYTKEEHKALMTSQNEVTRQDIDVRKKMASDSVAVEHAAAVNTNNRKAINEIRGGKTYSELSKSEDLSDKAKFAMINKLNEKTALAQTLVQAAMGQKVLEQIKGTGSLIDAARRSGKELSVKERIALMQGNKISPKIEEASAQAEGVSTVKEDMKQNIEKADVDRKERNKKPKSETEELAFERQAAMGQKIAEQVAGARLGVDEAYASGKELSVKERVALMERTKVSRGVEKTSTQAEKASNVKSDIQKNIAEADMKESAKKPKGTRSIAGLEAMRQEKDKENLKAAIASAPDEFPGLMRNLVGRVEVDAGSKKRLPTSSNPGQRGR